MVKFVLQRRLLCISIAVIGCLLSTAANAQHHGHGGSSYSRSHHGHGHYSDYGHRHGGGGGFSLSINSAPSFLRYGGYGYSGLGYSGLGYGGLPYSGYGLGGVGVSNYGLGSYGIGSFYGDFPFYSPYSAAYRGYSPYASSIYGLNRSSVAIGIYARPSNGYVPADSYQPSYRYDAVPPASHYQQPESYGVPGYNSEFSHRPSDAYRSGRFDETYPDTSDAPNDAMSDLRPGMVLPDGSKVISVGPPKAATESSAEPVESDRGEL